MSAPPPPSSALPAEVQDSLDTLRDALAELETQVDQVAQLPPLREIAERAAPMENAQLHTALAYTLDSLYFGAFALTFRTGYCAGPYFKRRFFPCSLGKSIFIIMLGICARGGFDTEPSCAPLHNFETSTSPSPSTNNSYKFTPQPTSSRPASRPSRTRSRKSSIASRAT
jgi:hypothetical protein